MKIYALEPNLYPKLTVKSQNQPESLSKNSSVSLPNFGCNHGFYTANILFKGVQNTAPVKDDNFYSDTKAFSKYLHTKIENSFKVPTVNDVKSIVENVKKVTGADEKTVREVIARLVQFSSTESLKAIQKKFEKDGVQKIYDDCQKFSTTSFMYYLHNSKEQFDTNPKGEKHAVFLDPVFLNYYEQSGEFLYEFNNKLEENNLNAYIIDGWNGIIDGEKILYSFFGESSSVNECAIKTIKRMQETGESFDDIFNKGVAERAKKLLGDNIKIKILQNDGINDTSNEGIKKLLTPPMPSEEEIESFIEIIASGTENSIKAKNLDDKYAKTNPRALIAKYLDNMFVGYSPKSLNNELITKYNEIKKIAKTLHVDPNKIKYIIPNNHRTKSFDLITYQFFVANGIDQKNIIKLMGSSPLSYKEISQEDLCVVLDDFAGSGESLFESGFNFWLFMSQNRNGNLILAPMVAADEAKTAFKNNSESHPRLIVLNHKTASYDEFKKKFLKNYEQEELMKFMQGAGGYASCGTCCAFPFSDPDNNSNLGHLFSLMFLANKYTKNTPSSSTKWTFRLPVSTFLRKIDKNEHQINCTLT